MICHCYDNKHGVAWAQVHSISFLADRNINFNSMDKFKFWTDFEREIEFWKCSFKLLNVMLIKESHLWPFATGVNLACLLRQFGSVNNPWMRLFCSVCFVNGSHMVSNKTLLVLQPRQLSWSLN